MDQPSRPPLVRPAATDRTRTRRPAALLRIERLRALNRFGLGARVGETDTAPGVDARGWLRAQLEPGNALLPDARDLATPEDIASILVRQREARQSGEDEARREAQRAFRELVERESLGALDRRVQSDAPFVERLVAFWSNHLCVSAAGGPAVAAWAGHYERTVIRPHVLGRFEAMLLASARHPAMLVYLDNTRSVGPGSRVGRLSAERGRARGLNENYARELLELHTLGVDGGYGQDDVVAVARILTGWTADPGLAAGARAAAMRPGGRPAPRRTRPGFAFRPEVHEPGAKDVLGRRYGPGGLDEGEALVRDLARHPSTATFLATRLARHFVADEPPAGAVERLAAVYRDTEGDLLEVSRALVEVDEAWDPAHRKLRTPQDWVVASLRALRAPEFPPPLLGILRELRHPLWAPDAPKGFDDRARVWADPDGLMNRAELARSVARRLGEAGPPESAPGVRGRGRRGFRGMRGGGGLDPVLLLDVVEPDQGGALATMLADDTIPVDERVALALGGPAFQWR